MSTATLTRPVASATLIPIVHNLDLTKPDQAAALARVRAILDGASLRCSLDGVGLTGYARISSDGDGRGLGVERQVQDIVRLAQFAGEPVVQLIVENDESASEYAGKPRELWGQLVADLAAGRATHVLATSTSRLTREPADLDHLLKLRRVGASFSTAQGVRMYPTMTAFEVQMIRMAGAQDAAESDLISERTKRAFDQNAANGTPHGPIAYGWDRHRERNGTVVDTINPDQAAVMHEARERVMAGESLRSIARELTEREVPAPRGGAWSTSILKKILTRERNAARRVHRGVVVGAAAWDPIFSDEEHAAVVSVLTDPRRTTARGGNHHLLSGLLVCGRCGSQRVWITFAAASTNTQPGYQCKECFGLRRKQGPLDVYVAREVCNRLSEPDALDWLAQDQNALDAARADLAGLRGKSDEIADMLAEGELTREQAGRANAKLQPRIAAAEALVESVRPVPPAVRNLIGLGSLAATVEAWELLSIEAQRDAIRSLVTITLLPTKRRKFDPDGLRLDWRA